jgi:hypothetical protein
VKVTRKGDALDFVTTTAATAAAAAAPPVPSA